MSSIPCGFCRNEFPVGRKYCPHCAHLSYFPNVKEAQEPKEIKALDRRYAAALRDAAGRGARKKVQSFEVTTRSSKAVRVLPLRELERLASSDKEIFSTYYKLLEAEVRVPDDTKWDVLRARADDTLFPGYKEEIRFAALSLDGVGPESYGECSFVLRDDMIAHRASVFEGNSALIMKRKLNVPPGFRAPWEERAKLCVAKLAGAINSRTKEAQFPGILLKGGSSEKEDFVEVHIWGPMTMRTVERIWVRRKTRRQSFIKALRDRIKGLGVVLGIVP